MIPSEIAETIVSPKAYAEETPIDEAFTFLRREMPLAQAEPAGVEKFWAVTKQADIREVERQNDLFHNGDKSATLTTIEADQKVRE